VTCADGTTYEAPAYFASTGRDPEDCFLEAIQDLVLKSNFEAFEADISPVWPDACRVCFNRWPTMQLAPSGVCEKCERDREPVRKFSAENNMIPAMEPPVFLLNDHGAHLSADHLALVRDYDGCALPAATEIEEMLIALVSPIMSVFRLKHGQSGFSGNVHSFTQNVHAWVEQLPRNLSQVDILIITKIIGTTTGGAPKLKQLRCRIGVVLAWLLVLKKHHPLYADVAINNENLMQLPVDDYIPVSLLPHVVDNNKDQSENEPHAQTTIADSGVAPGPSSAQQATPHTPAADGFEPELTHLGGLQNPETEPVQQSIKKMFIPAPTTEATFLDQNNVIGFVVVDLKFQL
jgi:hypothetical protein